MNMYRFVRPFLFKWDAERAHRAAMWCGRASRPLHPVIRGAYSYDHPALRIRVCGIEFKNPVGLAAGFDKDGRAIPFLAALGFGHLEIGTVTPEPQPGNPRPRLFRLPADRALVNRMGFNSRGAGAARAALARADAPVVIGINIGKNKATPNEKAAGDYLAGFRSLADYADYVAVNVSSPNTPGLRALQAYAPLKELLGALQAENRKRERPVPLFLKVAPDLNPDELDTVLGAVVETDMAGVIATNTTTSRSGLATHPDEVARAGEGGVSGAPLRERSSGMIRAIFMRTKGALPIIGVGGVFTAEDAYEKIKAGASLVQIFTGFIYEGPGVVKRISRGLVELLARDGFRSVGEAVGADAR